MAIINFTGFEGKNNTGGIDGLDANPFSPGTEGSYSTTVKRTGLASARVNKSGANIGAMNILNAINADGTRANYGGTATLYSTFYFRYATKPASASEEIFRVSDDNGYQLSGRITSGGKLQLYGSGGTTQLGSDGATTLSADTWYKISVKSGSGSGTAPYELYINGTLELSGTYSAVVSPSNTRFHIGCYTDRNGQNLDMFFDDVLCSDSGWPDGDVTKEIEVVAIHPTANGTSMTWSAGTGASDYTQVDEVEYDDTDYVMTPSNGTNPNQALFAMENSSTVGISGTILALKSIVVSRENTANSSAHFVRVKSGATNSDSSAYNGGTAIVGQGRLLELDPNTASAWTTTTIDAVEIGVVENNNVAVRGVNICGYVVFIPSTNTNYQETYTETTTVTDTFIKVPSRILSEVTTITATLINTANKILTQTVTLTDTFLRTISKVFSETLTLTATFIKNATRIFNETVNLTDTFISLKALFAEFTENFSLTDTITRIEQRILTETTTITDTLVRIANRIFTETVTLTDTFVSLVEKRLELLETTTISDVIIKLEQRILSETLTLTDTFAYLRLKIKELTETTTLTDTLPRTISRVLSEVLTITDTLIKVLARVAFTEVLTLTATSLQMGQRILTETVTITDSILRLYNKILTETVSLADQLIMRLNGIITNLWAKVSRTIDTWNKTPRN